jgi:hypothetical protein
MVLPSLTCMSGPPDIEADGTANKHTNKSYQIEILSCLLLLLL